jgi:methylamine dehydrogenase light chain
MRSLDQLVEQSTRSLAHCTSRRSLLAHLGRLLTGAAVLPLLPIDRGSRAHANEAHPGPDSAESCDYWKYCAIDGFLCACCGGTSTSCPPGTAASPISWVGTCHNARDGRDYMVSYNDCCGKSTCGTCDCTRAQGEKPMYRPSRNNDLNWCMANTDSNYHCTVSVILGVAEK